jgi:hypothetical protein
MPIPGNRESIALVPLPQTTHVTISGSAEPGLRDAESSFIFASNSRQDSDISAPSNHAVDPDDEPVSPHYQMVLLLAGFLMIFQTIGINQSYGIFQVCTSAIFVDSGLA